MMKIVVLVSGNGSNLQALLDACAAGNINGSVRAVFSNNASAFALQRARTAAVPAHTLSATNYPDRAAFDQQLMREIDLYQPDLLVLAGYMRILSHIFVQHYSGRILNIHPSLLPKYPGLHTHQQAIANGDSEHGASVHFVTEQLDGGPLILQARVPLLVGDTPEEVQMRVQHQEYIIYPRVIRWFCAGRLQMRDNMAWLDGAPLPAWGYTAE